MQLLGEIYFLCGILFTFRKLGFACEDYTAKTIYKNEKITHSYPWYLTYCICSANVVPKQFCNFRLVWVQGKRRELRVVSGVGKFYL